MSRMRATFWLTVGLGAMLILFGCDQQSGTTSKPTPANVPARQGIGVAIVVDCSGSMQDNVPGGVKYVIAQNAVRELIQRSAAWKAKHPDQTLEVALYRFSDSCTQLVPFSTPDLAVAEPHIKGLVPNGGTAIGTAAQTAKEGLDATGLTSKHVVIVTDGENMSGPSPAAVAQEWRQMKDAPSVYLVAFDVNSKVFQGVKDAGWAVHSASDAGQLQQALDQVFGENILLEK